ncbi:putative eukaryotic translation initiation factor 2 subunit beta [Rhodotorula toruloides]|nr:putative eukaryotic translation initiation factor 2 subunit beta [Rhodotorula toruloides]
MSEKRATPDRHPLSATRWERFLCPEACLRRRQHPLEERRTGEGKDPFAKEDRDKDSQTSKAEAAAQAKAWLKEDRDYTYIDAHPSLSGGAGKKKYRIPPPQLFREGNKRSMFANIADICKRMHCQPKHIIQFLFAELGTSGSSMDRVGWSSRVGSSRQIENVLQQYIVKYVTCKTCKSPDTTLTKDNRLTYLLCGLTCSVAGIKPGFQAATRAARRAARA